MDETLLPGVLVLPQEVTVNLGRAIKVTFLIQQSSVPHVCEMLEFCRTALFPLALFCLSLSGLKRWASALYLMFVEVLNLCMN